MLIESEEIEYCKLNVHYEADIEKVKEKVDEAVSELRKTNIPGFRRGKAPDYAIKARAKKQINEWVTREMSAQAYDDVIFEKHIKTIGYPQFTNIVLLNNKFSCDMTILKKPDFELKDYKEFEIPKPHMDRDVDSQLEASLQDLRTKFGDVEPYGDDDFVEKNDQVTMDYKVLIDNKEIEELSSNGVLYKVGEDAWPGFSDNFLGMTPGETREFDYVIPSHIEKYGDKNAHFVITIHMGTKTKPCSLDDELAKKVGLNTFDEVIDKLKVLINARIKNTEQKLICQQIINKLVENHNFEVPSYLILTEAQSITMQKGIDWEKLKEEERIVFMDMAKKNVKLSLVLDSIRDVEPEAVLSDAETVQIIKQQIEAQGGDSEKFLVESRKNGRLIGMMAAIRDDYTIQFLLGQCKVIE